ncbi:TAXI family TRAP transporter solute-binding subunit [Micromonospora sp. NBC_01796]|uniref:TAXI family TRAP transporter solute-binding subunit n=1 Tax=Micromonospora sp. NBC_01796 TaxID=2975987 RepID=UPI002DD83D80|nr:TAXI family TRAP transporter solute-binding subunit [Micromonospora sp. NBC_01796]WSA85434.1 TAXI family TRAP transporter solute-binding subunit [Micromonospora sp. NBC_01796]
MPLTPPPPDGSPRSARRAVSAVCAAILTVLAAGCADAPEKPVLIRIATGSPTAVYYAFGQSLVTIINREIPGVRASVVVTAASAENVELVSQGGAELGFTQADTLPATAGASPAVLGVARLYDDLLHLVVRADRPIRRLADLRGRTVSVGAPGSGTEITANRLLDVAGLTPGSVDTRRLGLDASVAALESGEIDGFIFSGGLPVQAVAELVRRTPARIVDLGEWTEPLRRDYSQVYVNRDIPTSVYGLPPVTTVADPNYLVVSADLPQHLVYELTRLLMERRIELGRAHPAAGRMSIQSAIATAPLPLHPGAAEYYRASKP